MNTPPPHIYERADRTPLRLTPVDDVAPVLDLIRTVFASMNDRIDPPSSAARLTEADLTEAARTGEVWVMHDAGTVIACMVLTPGPDHLYLGKLAVDAGFRGQGLARLLTDLAVRRAADLGLPFLRLETRVELTENHQAFAALGFVETTRTSHPGFDRPTSITFEWKAG